MNLSHNKIPLPRRLSRDQIFSNPWLTLYEDSVEFSPTHTGGYAILKKPDFSLVIPLAGHRVCLVRQYRYPVGRWGYEFPQGSTQDAGSRPPAEQEALRELREETGLIAHSLEPLGSIHESAGRDHRFPHHRGNGNPFSALSPARRPEPRAEALTKNAPSEDEASSEMCARRDSNPQPSDP